MLDGVRRGLGRRNLSGNAVHTRSTHGVEVHGHENDLGTVSGSGHVLEGLELSDLHGSRGGEDLGGVVSEMIREGQGL